ncbi:TPA: hypothetical protein QCX21_005940 [Bacillus toyonensis]|nr:hypothetical protein [Bacillus toyonensis]
MNKFFSSLLGLAIIGVFCYGVFYSLSWFYQSFLSLDARISAALITGLFAILGASLSISIPKYFEKKKEIESYHRDQKSPMYKELLDYLFSILMGQKAGKQMSEKESIEFMSKFTQNIILWGSEDVIKQYGIFRNYFMNRPVNKKTDLVEIKIMEGLLLAVRKDMGYNNKHLETGDLLSLFINDLKEYLDKEKTA